MGKPFEGCIKNIIHNSKLYDLAEPGLQLASKPGCLQLEDVCKTSFPGIRNLDSFLKKCMKQYLFDLKTFDWIPDETKKYASWLI